MAQARSLPESVSGVEVARARTRRSVVAAGQRGEAAVASGCIENEVLSVGLANVAEDRMSSWSNQQCMQNQQVCDGRTRSS